MNVSVQFRRTVSAERCSRKEILNISKLAASDSAAACRRRPSVTVAGSTTCERHLSSTHYAVAQLTCLSLPLLLLNRVKYYPNHLTGGRCTKRDSFGSRVHSTCAGSSFKKDAKNVELRNLGVLVEECAPDYKTIFL